MHKIIALKLTACTDCTQKLHTYRYTYAGYAYIYTIATYKSLNFVHNGFPYRSSYQCLFDMAAINKA